MHPPRWVRAVADVVTSGTQPGAVTGFPAGRAEGSRLGGIVCTSVEGAEQGGRRAPRLRRFPILVTGCRQPGPRRGSPEWASSSAVLRAVLRAQGVERDTLSLGCCGRRGGGHTDGGSCARPGPSSPALQGDRTQPHT